MAKNFNSSALPEHCYAVLPGSGQLIEVRRGEKGYYVCSDTWFDAYVYQAAIEREYLGDLASCADLPPIELAPWDPMGTLAD